MRYILFAFLMLLAGCATEEKPVARASYHPVGFDALKGWQSDHQAETLAALHQSCNVLGAKKEWQAACASLPAQADDAAARSYFETYFQPYEVAGPGGTEGLFTGYYVPELAASAQQGGRFQTPLYARPGDLISADLGLFKDELKGQKIVGKVDGTKFIPYDARAEITRNGLNGRAQPLAWVDDPVSAFFLEVQGSGRLRFEDSHEITVGYDGANGRSYVAIGRIMAARGDVPKPVTMPAIRAWLKEHPEQAQQVMDENPSYVFFRRLPDENVVGSQGVALTARRSMAVDASIITLGAPLWLESYDGQGSPLNRLMVAQDTGGAIKGAVRGDFFWGAGDEAGAQAGAMQSTGRYYMLLPKGLIPRDK